MLGIQVERGDVVPAPRRQHPNSPAAAAVIPGPPGRGGRCARGADPRHYILLCGLRRDCFYYQHLLLWNLQMEQFKGWFLRGLFRGFTVLMQMSPVRDILVPLLSGECLFVPLSWIST